MSFSSVFLWTYTNFCANSSLWRGFRLGRSFQAKDLYLVMSLIFKLLGKTLNSMNFTEMHNPNHLRIGDSRKYYHFLV